MTRCMVLVLLCLASLPSCSKSNPQVSSQAHKTNSDSSFLNGDDPERSTHSPSSYKTLLTSVQQDACKQFFTIIDESLNIHLAYETSDRTALLAQTMEKISSIEIEPFERREKVRTALNHVTGTPGKELEDCESLIQLKNSSPWTLESNEDPLVSILRRMLNFFFFSIDVQSNYFDPLETQKLTSATAFGTGIILNERTDYKIGRTEDWQPAYLVTKGMYPSENANITFIPPNTRIWEIEDLEKNDGTMLPIRGMTYKEAFRRLNQIHPKPIRPTLNITASFPNQEKKIFSVFLRNYVRTFAWSETLQTQKGEVFHIKLTSFSEGLNDQLLKEWLSLLGKAKKYPSEPGIILDLRGNLGGHLSEVKNIAESLLPLGSIITHIQEKGENPIPIKTEKAPIHFETPLKLLVLVDSGSASASEILAAALEDNQYAIVLGEHTWGKGVGQVFVPLPAPLGGSIQVTNRYYFSPKGKSHRWDGLEPTVFVRDRINDEMRKESSTGFTLSDIVERGTFTMAIPKPLSADVDFFPPLTAPFNDESVRKIHHLQEDLAIPEPESCQRMPNDPEFKEEDDCLLDWALAYFDQLKR